MQKKKNLETTNCLSTRNEHANDGTLTHWTITCRKNEESTTAYINMAESLKHYAK